MKTKSIVMQPTEIILNVGDKIWVCPCGSENNDDAYRELRISKVSRGYWLAATESGISERKIPKLASSRDGVYTRRLQGSYTQSVAYLSQQAMAQSKWIAKNRDKIINAVGRVDDFETLLALAAVLGMNETMAT